MSDWARELTDEGRGRFDEALAGRRADRDGGARGLVMAGGAVLLVFFGLIGGWAALSPLDSAVVAEGAFEAAGNRKVLQHRDGGVVRSIEARDGDKVQAGQVLVELDDTSAQALVSALSAQADSLAILRARLVAERDDAPDLVEPPGLTATKGVAGANPLLVTQRAALLERRRQMEGERSILARVAAQQGDQAQGLASQVRGVEAQLASVRDETEATRRLFASGYATRTRLAGLERTLASLDGDRGRLRAQIASIEGSIAETGLRQAQLRRDRLSEVAEQLRQVEQQAAELAPRLIAARDTLDRAIMRAPASGVIYGLNVFTVGGVIAPGQKVLEIVPDEDRADLVIRVAAADAERVKAGQQVDVVLTGVPVSRRPLVTGHVGVLSADRIEEPRTGAAYYEARVKVDSIRRGPGTGASGDIVRIGPGMPGEAIISSGSRTVLEYLLGPLGDQVRRAMREE
jgi:HlyD family type I secretion membrane fusion protein